MSWKTNIVFLLIIGGVLFFAPCHFSGASVNLKNSADFLQLTGGGAGFSENTDPEPIIGRIIKTLLGFLGIIFFILIIYGGFLWMTSAGNKDKVEKAREIIVNSVAGLAIVLFAYAITWFIVYELTQSTGFLG